MEPPIVTQARSHAEREAFRTAAGTRSYADLLARSAAVASALLDGTGDLEEARVALLVAPGFDYIAAQWGVWRAGGVVLPLSLHGAESEWEHALADSGTTVVIVDAESAKPAAPLCGRLGVKVHPIESLAGAGPLPSVDPARRAMILYTSGTTSKPKGVVTTHANITAQIKSLIEAWEWTADDRIPLFLPLHHIHGVINVGSCALWSGATIEPFPRFDLNTILDRVKAGAYTLFMAVPTIYVKLIQALEAMSPEDRAAVVTGFKKMRLMVSGSAALPASVFERWEQLTGQRLLERYGMTEIGMALSNPYHGERRPGTVGMPLPGVDVRLKAEGDGESGEIQVSGPGVFKGYWNRPEVNAESFDDGWFRTGDVAVVEGGYYRILGRSSVDIIKSGGYKLSALEIESALLDHPAIRECAVVGVPDDTWGEAVAAAVVLKEGTTLDLPTLRDWCRGRMSPYKIPHRLLVAAELPRNAMGKVTKPAVRGAFTGG